MLKFVQLRIIWPVLILLASFVIFFEFIADVGGSENAASSPPFGIAPTASPSGTPTPEP